MITFNEAQLMAWLSPVLWPFLRVLAVFTVAPIFSMRVIPTRAKVGLAFLVAVCAQGILPEQPIVDINGREAIGVVVQQVVVGLAILWLTTFVRVLGILSPSASMPSAVRHLIR